MAERTAEMGESRGPNPCCLTQIPVVTGGLDYAEVTCRLCGTRWSNSFNSVGWIEIASEKPLAACPACGGVGEQGVRECDCDGKVAREGGPR